MIFGCDAIAIPACNEWNTFAYF